MRIAERINQIGVDSAFYVARRARELEARGRNVIHLEVGEPDFPTPDHIVEEAKKALDEGWTHYAPVQGFPDLREAVASHVSRTRSISVGPEQVLIVPGGKPIIFFSMLALLEPGDEVIYPNPGFPIYESMARFPGAIPVPIPLIESKGFSLDLNLLKDKLTAKTRLLILNSPQNPTGGIIPHEDMAAIAEMVRNRDLMVLSDEVYSRIYYDKPPVSIISYPGMREKAILLDGFSKTFSMTGWRVGFGVMPAWLLEAVTKLVENSVSCTAPFTQRAALAALRGSDSAVQKMVEEFRRRRHSFCAGLNELPGFHSMPPAGAFYAFANITGTGMSSRELEDALLQEAGVACVSGTIFGRYGEGYLRFSFASSSQKLAEALERMCSFLNRRLGGGGGHRGE